MKRFKVITGTVLVTCLLFTPAVSWACSVPGNSPHQLDSNEIGLDQSPPSKVTVVDVHFERPDNVDGYCWGLGFVTLTIDPATDDRTDGEHMGYLLSGNSESWPEGFGFSANDNLGPMRAEYALTTYDTLYLNWTDMSDDGSKTIAFTFVISAVDLAGNQGPPSDPIRIYDPGSIGGCATGGLGDLSPAFLLVFLFANRFRRHRLLLH